MLSYTIEKTKLRDSIDKKYASIVNLFIGGMLCTKDETSDIKQKISIIAISLACIGAVIDVTIFRVGRGNAVRIPVAFALSAFFIVQLTRVISGVVTECIHRVDGFEAINKQIALFIILCGINYFSKLGFECIASVAGLCSETAQAIGLVIASLVSIYASRCLYSDKKSNVSTTSGLMGVIAFTIGATAIYTTSLHSCNRAIFILKAIPIFLAFTETIYENGYDVYLNNAVSREKIPNASLKYTISFILVSVLLTSAFVGGEYLTKQLCSTKLLDANIMSHSAIKLATEFVLTPTIVIAASLLCNTLCNSIAQYFNNTNFIHTT